MNTYIKEMRKIVGMTQAELAEEIGVTTVTVGNWERGDTTPDALQVWNCARALKCTPNDIVGWKDMSISPDEQDLIKMFRCADERGRENLMCIAKLESERSEQ